MLKIIHQNYRTKTALLVIMSCVDLICCAIINNKQNNGVQANIGAMVYLAKYGYMDQSASNPKKAALMSQESLVDAIKEFQAFASLNITGELDDETIKMMNMPRCGVKDKVGFGTNAKRKKRYALQGSRWRVRDLTYKVTKYPLGLTRSEVDRDVTKAFKVWEEVTDLTFTALENNNQKLHIEVRFERGEHGDGDSFDGPGGTLAHAYFPIYGGDVHFDASETWTVNSFRGTNLFQVAAHEFGHSLGLSHSDNTGALMAPFYRGYQPNFKLHRDDMKAIRKLYGDKKVPPAPKPDNVGSDDSDPIVPPPAFDNELCSDSSVDAIVTMVDRKTYVFKGANYYKLTNDGIESGYPRNISLDFESLPAKIDAAFTWTNGKTYFFKDSEYWRFTDMVMDKGYPKPISKGFNGIPNHVDAAFVWSGNGKIYFMKKSEYWRFDPSQRPPVKTSYPKKISTWEGIPNDLDGALQYSNGYTYFFKNGKYYRFNDRAFKVDNADPAFPRPAGYWWFGCPNKDNFKTSGLEKTDTILPMTGADDVAGDDASDADNDQTPDIVSDEKQKSSQKPHRSQYNPGGIFHKSTYPDSQSRRKENNLDNNIDNNYAPISTKMGSNILPYNYRNKKQDNYQKSYRDGNLSSDYFNRENRRNFDSKNVDNNLASSKSLTYLSSLIIPFILASILR